MKKLIVAFCAVIVGFANLEAMNIDQKTGKPQARRSTLTRTLPRAQKEEKQPKYSSRTLTQQDMVGACCLKLSAPTQEILKLTSESAKIAVQLKNEDSKVLRMKVMVAMKPAHNHIKSIMPTMIRDSEKYYDVHAVVVRCNTEMEEAYRIFDEQLVNAQCVSVQETADIVKKCLEQLVEKITISVNKLRQRLITIAEGINPAVHVYDTHTLMELDLI